MTLLSGTTEWEWTVIRWTIGVSTVAQWTWYGVMESRYARTEKQRAYALCALSSGVMTVGSIPYFQRIKNGDLTKGMQADDTLAVILTTFFLTFLVWDLGIGVCRYRSKIDPLSGWVHHGTYLCMLTWVLNRHYSGLFVGLCVMELPTLFLSLGSMHAPWRRDYVFASTFVLTRILFHGYILTCAITLFGWSSSIVLALAAVLPVHIYWFVGFIQQQKRLVVDRKIRPSSHALARQRFPGSFLSNHPTVQPALVSAH